MMHLLLSVSDGDLCYAHFPYLGHRGRGYFMLRPSEMERMVCSHFCGTMIGRYLSWMLI